MERRKVERLPNGRSILTCENGRMVILEHADDATAEGGTVTDLARGGKEEGFVRYGETAENTVNAGGDPGMILRILIRPSIHVGKAGQLAAVTAVAVARAIERVSDIDVKIRWVNDLYHGSRKIGAIMTNTQIKANGFLDYAVICVALALSPEDYSPKLGDVIRQVFCDENPSLCDRLGELISKEFFEAYDDMMLGEGCMEEYRRRSTVIGRRVKVLCDDGFAGGHILDIDNNAGLIVQLRHGKRVTVSSRSEVIL